MCSIEVYIDDYLENGSYRGLVSKFSRKSNEGLLSKLDDFLRNNQFNIDYISVSQKLHSMINNIKECPRCYCGNLLSYKNITIGYYEYCSVRCQSSSNETKEKLRKTNIKKYGVSHHSKRDSFRSLMSNKNKKGLLGFGSDIYKKSIMEKYGVSNISKLDSIAEKKSKTWHENWNLLSEKEREDFMESKSKKYTITRKKKFFKKFNKKWNGEYKIIDSSKYETVSKVSGRGLYKVHCNKCDDDFNILKSSLYQRESMGVEICTNCNPYRTISSSGELEIFEFISNYIEDIELNNRTILDGKEIDIYLPDLKLGIEYNGLYWHSELYKEDNYHKNKTDFSESKGIRLIQIFEDEWLYKKDIVKSILLNLLGGSERIYARRCEIREVNNKEVREFLNINHIQGFVGSKIKLGLYYNEKLVSLMTFGNLRKNLGHVRKEGSYELLRFCNKLNTTVVGGASRLFKYFLRNYNPEYILSYADRRWSVGNLYENMGFTFKHDSRPSWSYNINGCRLNRFNFRKDVLVSEGFDLKKTAREIMLGRGYYRIYDCGSKKYEFYT